MRKHFEHVTDYLFLTVGAGVAAIGINFMACQNLAFGGGSGLSIIIQYITDMPISVLNLLINLPLFLLGMKYIGKKFLIRSLYSTVLLSAFLNFTSMIQECSLDLIISTILGGILLGIGVGIIAKSGGSTGGTDILALILHHHTQKPLGNYIFLIDGAIIFAGGIVFGLNKALYSILVVFFISQSVNKTMKLYDEIQQSLFLPIISN